MESRCTFTKNLCQIKPQVFQWIDKIWEPHSVDLFADHTAHLLPKYVSWHLDPGTIHTDARKNPFINPPWESNRQSTQQNMTKAGTSSDSCGSLVVQCDLVSPDEIFGNLSSSFPQQERYPGDNNISPSPSSQTMDAFRLTDVVNFLATLKHDHKLQLGTLKSIRTAIAHLHNDSRSISSHPLINTYFDSIVKQFPPVAIHKPQKKFSDLARISFDSYKVDLSDGYMHFKAVFPKGRRKKHRIFKGFRVHPHQDRELCPVFCFLALKDHPQMNGGARHSALFIKANNVAQPVTSSTTSSCLHRYFTCISLSTTEPRTSIRSLASSAALDKGIGIQDIVTLGNWASSDTFLQRYQRNHMADINFITTVLAHSGEDNEIFYDADEDWTLD
ncbi:hypothetical protein AB4K20DRAFT_1973474 [Rhizopus microsporus]